MKIARLLLLAPLVGCTGPDSGNWVPKKEQRFTGEVDGRTITIIIKDDTAYGGKPARIVKLDDPLDTAMYSTFALVNDPDSLVASFSPSKQDSGAIRIGGTRHANGTWKLTYARSRSMAPVPLEVKEAPWGFDLEPITFNGGRYIHSYRITEHGTDDIHPLHTFLEEFLCEGQTYEDFAGKKTPEESMSESYSAELIHRNDAWITFKIEYSFYQEGMAHDQMRSRYLNYDLVHDREVKLKDAISPSGMSTLKALAKKAFYAKYTDRRMRNNTFEFTENVAFLRNGIQFEYQPYQMGPFVMGYMSMIVPYSEVSGLWASGSPFAQRLLPK